MLKNFFVIFAYNVVVRRKLRAERIEGGALAALRSFDKIEIVGSESDSRQKPLQRLNLLRLAVERVGLFTVRNAQCEIKVARCA